MAVLNTANRIYSSGKLVYRIFLNTVLVYIDNFQVFKKRVLDDGGIFKETPIVFNDEKLLLTPNAYKTGKIYSALPHDGSGDFTFSRNSSAMYIEDGIIKTALPNVPRIQDGKILIEGQTTNTINISNFFNGLDTANFKTTDGIPNDYSDWTGTLVQTLVYGVSINTTSIIRHIPYTLGDHFHSFSFIIEKGAVGDFVSFFIHRLDVRLNFQFSTGNLTNDINILKHRVTKIKDGIFLIDIVTTEISSPNIGNYQLNVGSVPDGTSTQTEIGDFKISYIAYNIDNDNFIGLIPTYGTAATRLADIATVTPPTGVTEIIETIDGVEQSPITTIPPTYQLPIGEIDNVKMI